MKVQLLYFDGCPHWKAMAGQLDTLANELGFTWTPVPVETPESAVEYQFHGSPSLHLNGDDPFANPDTQVGLTCRIYQTATGPSGTPDINVLRQALLSA
jgi:hypothetical protein